MFRRLADSFKAKYGRKDKLGKQLEIVQVFDQYKKELIKLFPNEKTTKPVSLKNKVLTVQTSSAVLATELRFAEERIIKKMSEKLGRELVERVIYRF